MKTCIFSLVILSLFGALPLAAQQPRLSLDKTVFAPGEAITVQFEAPAGWPRNAWVGMFDAKHPHGSEAENDKFDLKYQYIEKKTSGTFTFTAPTTPGSYDFRLHDTDTNGTEHAHVKFTVGSGSSGQEGTTTRLGLGLTEYSITSKDQAAQEKRLGDHTYCALSHVMSGGFNSYCAVALRGSSWVLIAVDPGPPDPWQGESQACAAICFDR